MKKFEVLIEVEVSSNRILFETNSASQNWRSYFRLLGTAEKDGENQSYSLADTILAFGI